MAYITKDQVKEKTVKIKAIAKKYGCKVSVSGSNSSNITVRIMEGKFDFWKNLVDTAVEKHHHDVEFVKENAEHYKKYGTLQINHYYLDSNFSGEVLKMLQEINAVLHEGHFDNSDAMTDYFHCAWYIGIQVGCWNKPYKLVV